MKISIKSKTKVRKYFAVHNAQPGRRIRQEKLGEIDTFISYLMPIQRSITRS